jgi:Kef-type K+ transport system membrane component KefB
VAGPALLGVVTAHDQIDLLAQVGVAVLLFVVGLKLDLQHIRHIGPVALATGLGQLTFTIVIRLSDQLRCRWARDGWRRSTSPWR